MVDKEFSFISLRQSLSDILAAKGAMICLHVSIDLKELDATSIIGISL